jgi:uncharacterized membrane protein YdbT with pleckstrin-like domain
VLVGVILVAGLALTILGGFLKRMTTTYTITNRRLNIKRALVSRQIQETRLERVENVSYGQSVYQRVMQIGDVDFDTASDDEYGFIFTGVAQPEDVVHQVGQATERATARVGSATRAERTARRARRPPPYPPPRGPPRRAARRRGRCAPR